MQTDPALRRIVGLMRAANDGDAGASQCCDLLAENYQHSRAPLDRDDALRELLDLKAHVTPELRYALARWIAGRITLKRGRKRKDVKKRLITPAAPPLDAALCIRALLDFGSATHPLGVHPNTRLAIADLLTDARKLKRGPRMAPPGTLRTLLAAHNARTYIAEGASARASIRRAESEAATKPGTVQRWLYPRRAK